MNPIKILFFFTILTASANSGASSDDHRRHSPFSKAQLISPYQRLSPSVRSVPVGLWISLKKGWHSYWLYTGDSGKTLKIHWTLPQGASMSSLKWPLPERIHFGSQTSLGYKNSFLLTSELSLPAKKPTHVQIKAQVEWFVCEEVCVPLRQSLKFSWPIQAKAKGHADWQALFDTTRQRQPQQAGQKLKLSQEGLYWKASFATQNPLKLVDVLPFSKYPLSLSPPLLSSGKEGHKHSFRILPRKKPGPSSPWWKAEDLESKVLVTFVPYSKADLNKKVNYRQLKNQESKKIGFIYAFSEPKNLVKSRILWFLLFSFLGGLLLNLMPCVLPIVFLKFSNTAQLVGQKKHIIVLENLFYSLGVITAFLVLAFGLFLIKKGGESAGWGFHLQSPFVLLSLIFLFALISLAFMGWFSLPAWPFFQEEKQSYSKQFLTGVLSTAVASPCTAPFMGAGVGYGLLGSGWDLILIFLFLGLGLSFPYLVLSVFPHWIKYVPLPGKWTQKLKHFMAFPMLSTTLWLIFVLNHQKPESFFVVLFSLLIMALGFWIVQQSGPRLKPLGYVILALAIAWPFFHIHHQGGATSKIQWSAFSLAKLQSAQAEGKALFVNVTANWCLTCKFNERVTFQNEEVIRFFKDKEILALKGDWTQPNKEITKLLESYNRAGIPFYLYIPAEKEYPLQDGASQPINKGHEFRLLPELLTPAVFFKYTQAQGSVAKPL